VSPVDALALGGEAGTQAGIGRIAGCAKAPELALARQFSKNRAERSLAVLAAASAAFASASFASKPARIVSSSSASSGLVARAISMMVRTLVSLPVASVAR
jgi:hypothetical protein